MGVFFYRRTQFALPGELKESADFAIAYCA